MGRKKKTEIEVVDKYSSKGINSHLSWVFADENDTRNIGIDRNNDIVDEGGKYRLFEEDDPRTMGEGCETVWFKSLNEAKNEVQRLYDTDEKIRKKTCRRR